MEKLVLIDGYSLLNRAFYATNLFTTKTGFPTNGIFGFIKLLFKIFNDVKPEYTVVCFDVKSPTFRHRMFNEYKGTRKPMPEELTMQVEPLKQLLEKMKIATCELPGYEADDLVGTLSNQFDVHSYIYTGDRDSFQLVNERTTVCYTKRGVSDLQVLTAENFTDEAGLRMPCQVIDLKALMGDKSDNIPGVPGIGEKTAISLLEQYGSLHGVYEHIEEIKGATQKKLIENKELAMLSYELATIDRKAPVSISLADCKTPTAYDQAVKQMFAEFEFRSFMALDIYSKEEIVTEKVAHSVEVTTNATEILDVIKNNRTIAVSMEPRLQIYAGEKTYQTNIRQSLLDDGIGWEEYLSVLSALFTDRNKKVIVFGYKTMLHDLDEAGIEALCQFEDVALLDCICHNVDPSLDHLLAERGISSDDKAFGISVIYERLQKEAQEGGLLELYETIEKPLLLVLFEMEKAGVHIDLSELSKQSSNLNERIQFYSDRIYQACGHTFNINSPKQLGVVLFEELGLPYGKKGKTGSYSTGAEVLDKLAEENAVVADVLKYRQMQKLLSTYVEGLRPLIRADGTVHTTFTQTIAATGRLSSVNPNLQNIPIRDEEGKELRKLFIPKRGNILIDADYSQIELRLMAHFSQCAGLVEAFNHNIDIHAVTASQVFGVKLEEVTPQMRRQAKAVNFGIIYGISDFGLARNLDIPVSRAKEFIEKYFATYPEIKVYMDQCVTYAKEHGYISTLTGRKRAIPEISSSNYNTRSFGERVAMNMPLQGSSADIIKIAMIRVAERLKEEGLSAKLILQVHDELVLDAPQEEEERAKEILIDGMEHAVSLSVPLTVEVHCGVNWYEAK